MKATIKSNAALLCLFAALHSPYVLADSEEIKYDHDSIFEVDVKGHDDDKNHMADMDDDFDHDLEDDSDHEIDDDDTIPIPEADTYAMMLAGLGLIGFMVYRRRTR